MINKIKLKSCTLDDLILENNIDIKKYNHWVIDVQGAELEVLKGSNESIKLCNSITVEVSTEDFYERDLNLMRLKNF